MRKLRRRRSLLLVGWIVLFGMPVLSAQVPNQKPTREKQKRALEIVSISVWRKWLNEDVAYIITDQERGDFATLTSEQQRDQFITDFWERRNPNPGSPENAFKDEHYRRFAYANEHFATKLPGWKTNRGRIYIIYGPPDQVDNHFSAAGSESAERILGAGAIPYDWELWHYRYIDGVGKNVAIKFVDTCACGEYQIPVEKKDLKKYTPQ